MNTFKSLLASGAIVATAFSAMAAPEVSVDYPQPGATLDSKELLATFNLSANNYSVTPEAKATIECLDTGDIYDCTNFADFSGMAIIVGFDTDEFVDNGEYEFVVYPGSINVDGVPNEKIVATYTLEDPNLGGASVVYPQIKLISSDPADGAGVAAVGDDSLNKISFVTDNDDAVNYIGWTLYDVTDAENPEWLYQGNENRIDPARNNGKNDDRWADGLFITIGGPDQKFVKGRKYEFQLIFCGIGYNPDNYQYPNRDAIQKSLELETSIYYNGLTEPAEYSPYKYVGISPDPETYVIESPEEARFTVTFSGPVKPDSFTITMGPGMSVTAGTYSAQGETDADGYSNVWEFVVSDQLAASLNEPFFSISAKDKDGLYVKGNADIEFDDYLYSFTYEATMGMPALVIVAPQDGETVESLSEIIVSNEDKLSMTFAWTATEKARICDIFGTEIRVLDDPEEVEGEQTQMKWTFDPITENGTYMLIIPKWYFAIGDGFDGSSSKQATFSFTVDNGTPDAPVFDIVPVAVDPADGETVTEISSVSLTFAADTFFPMMDGTPTAKLYQVAGTELNEVAESEPVVFNDYRHPTIYTFKFTEPVKENGTYIMKVARGSFCDETYAMEMGDMGHASDELEYTFIVDDTNSVAGVNADTEADVYAIDGTLVISNASAADIKALPAGIYIVNGKKVLKH